MNNKACLVRLFSVEDINNPRITDWLCGLYKEYILVIVGGMEANDEIRVWFKSQKMDVGLLLPQNKDEAVLEFADRFDVVKVITTEKEKAEVKEIFSGCSNVEIVIF